MSQSKEIEVKQRLPHFSINFIGLYVYHVHTVNLHQGRITYAQS